MKNELKIRMKNVSFWVQMILAVLMPVLAYAGLSAKDITSWAILGNLLLDAVSNPYVVSLIVVSVWNGFNNPTQKGFFK